MNIHWTFKGWHRRMKMALLLTLVLGDLPDISARVTSKTVTHLPNAPDSEICTSSSCKKTAETILENLNENQDPCEDFYEFACGGWVRKYSSNDTARNSLEVVENTIRQIIINLLENNEILNASSAVGKAKTFYNSCLGKMAEDGNEVIPKLLLEIIKDMGGWHILPDTILKKKQKFDLQKLMVDVNKRCFEQPLLFLLEEFTNQGMHYLILETKDIAYNETEDLRNVEILTKLCGMMGANVTEARAEFIKVLHLREKISNISTQSNEKDKNSDKIILTLEQLQNAGSFLNWSEYIDDVFSSPTINKNVTVDSEGFKMRRNGLASPFAVDLTNTGGLPSSFSMSDLLNLISPNKTVTVNVNLGYIRRLEKVIEKYNKTEDGQKTLVNLMMWHVTLNYFDYLNTSYEVEGRKIDIREQCALETRKNFRAAVGALYVKETLTSEPISKIKMMSRNIRRALTKIFTNAEWINAEMRKKILGTIDEVPVTIGYPDYILNITTLDKGFKELVVKPTGYYHNRLTYYEFIRLKRVQSISAHLKNKTCEEESSLIKMDPASTDAHYSLMENVSVIPAGFFQLPIYDENNTMSSNYGTLGMIIGHELTHAILRNHFSIVVNDTLSDYLNKETDCITDQYTNYTLNGMHLDGKKTLQENIADNSGLKASWYAYLDYSEKAKANYSLPGVKYNHRQQFFIAFAQLLCSRVYNDDELKKELEKEVHSVQKYRVIGPLSNSKEFSKEFNCPIGSKMNPDRKCMIW